MTLNEVYKKEVGSAGSLSPGLTEGREDQTSLVDIFIQNSKPNTQQRGSVRLSKGPSMNLPGPHGPIMSINDGQDQLHMNQPGGEQL